MMRRPMVVPLFATLLLAAAAPLRAADPAAAEPASAPTSRRASPATPVRTAPAAAPAASGVVQAPPTQPEDPFAAVVPVPDESDRSRDKGLRDALIAVLKRVAGRSDVAFSSILSRAPLLVQAYGFQKDPATQAVTFRATFDADGVQGALREEGLPVFGVDADIIEAWVVEVRGVSEGRQYARLLDYFASLRGVRRVDVDEVRTDALRLRMTVEGGVERVALIVAGGGVVRPQGPGTYDLVR